MAISPNIALTGKYVLAGAVVGLGIHAIAQGVSKATGDGDKLGHIGGGLVSIGAGAGALALGSKHLSGLPFATGNLDMVKSAGMLAAGLGAALLVNYALNTGD